MVIAAIMGAIGLGTSVGSMIANLFGQNEQEKAQQAAIEARKKADEYNASIHRSNANEIRKAAYEAIQYGSRQEEAFAKKINRVEGQQQSSFGSSGAVVNTGSTEDAIIDTVIQGREDSMTIRLNAQKEKDSLLLSAKNEERQAKLIEMGGEYSSPNTSWNKVGTILGGLGKTANMASKIDWFGRSGL